MLTVVRTETFREEWTFEARRGYVGPGERGSLVGGPWLNYDSIPWKLRGDGSIKCERRDSLTGEVLT